MKKILKYIPIIGLFMWACNPMDDINDNLDSQKEPYAQAIAYTLTANDYGVASKAALKVAENKSDSTFAKSIESQMAFNQKYSATDYVAPALADRFPSLNIKSSAVVTYDVYEKPEYLSNYEMGKPYELSKSDYDSVGGDVAKNGYFFPSEPAENHLPSILAENYPSAVEGDYAYVTYKLSDTDPAGALVVLNEDFQSYPAKYDTINGNGWTQNSVQGKNAYLAYMFGDNTYAQGRGYNGDDVEEFYLISPAVDLSNSVENTFSFDVGAGYWTHDGFEILISSDYDGSNFGTATWDNVTSNFDIPTSPEVPVAAYITMRNAGSMSLSDYSSVIYIAFKYSGGVLSGETTTYQIDNVLVKGVESGLKSVTASDYETYNDIYSFNGTAWSKDNGIIALDPADFSLMGISNFSASTLPANYLPQYLSLSVPFAQEGQLQPVSYIFYGSDTLLTASEYMFSMGEWQANNFFTTNTDQFVYATIGWLFDPTIKFSPSAADYQLLVDYVYTNFSPTYGSSYGNDEFYYGGSAYYQNFELRLSSRTKYNIPGFEGLSTEDGVKLAWQRVEEGITIMMGLMYPEAVIETSGVPVYYWITFKSFENDLSKNTYTGVFKYTVENVFVRDIELEDEFVTDGKLSADEVNWNR